MATPAAAISKSILNSSQLHLKLYSNYTLFIPISAKDGDNVVNKSRRIKYNRPAKAKAFVFFKAFALTGRHCCLHVNPGCCPGLGASALSGRVGKTKMRCRTCWENQNAMQGVWD